MKKRLESWFQKLFPVRPDKKKNEKEKNQTGGVA